MNTKTRTRKLVVTGLLTAITAILAFTPFGFIRVGIITPTTVHIPVIIGAILEGPVVGAVLGLMFGIFSLINAIIAPVPPLSPVFLNPLISILPRILLGIGAAYTFKLFEKLGKQYLGAAAAGVAGALINAIGVLGMILLLQGDKLIAAAQQSSMVVRKLLEVILLTNTLPEAILAAVIALMVFKAMRLVYTRRKLAEKSAQKK